MELDIAVRLDYAVAGPGDLLLQIEAAALDDQRIVYESLRTGWAGEGWPIAAESEVGRRLWLRLENDFECFYEARVSIERDNPDLSGLSQVQPRNLPGDVVRYLMPSRYCPSMFPGSAGHRRLRSKHSFSGRVYAAISRTC